MATILDAKRSIERSLFGIDGVTGVGINWDAQAIRVYVEALTPAIDAAVPHSISGYPVEVIVTGVFTTRASDFNLPEPYRRIRWRPVYGGVSGGHASVTAGTIGAVVWDTESGGMVVLSNNHVFANTTYTDALSAAAGDAILQPARFDAGTSVDTVATLDRWVPLDATGDNLVDCALARPISDDLVVPLVVGGLEPDGRLYCFAVNGTTPVVGGEIVHKYGRTPGHTSGEVIDVDFTTRIQYSAPEPIVFVDQILACIKVDGGDSGSLLLDDQNRAVGLVIASAKSDGVYYAIANKIGNVMAMLGIEFPEGQEDRYISGFDVIGNPVAVGSAVPSLVWVAAGVLLGVVLGECGNWPQSHD